MRECITDPTPTPDPSHQGPRQPRPRLRLVTPALAERPAAGFAMFPLRVLRNGGLSPWARLLYALLTHYDRLPEGAVPGRERLAADLGTSVDTVDRAAKELADAGLLCRRRRGRGQTNTYALLAGPTPDDPTPAPPLESAPVRTHGADAAPVRRLESAPMPTPESAPVRTNQDGVNQDGEEKKPSASQARRRLSALPATWTVGDRLQAYAMSKGFDPGETAHQAERFVNHAAAIDRRCKDWDAAFRNWLLTALEHRSKTPSNAATLGGDVDPFAGYRGGGR